MKFVNRAINFLIVLPITLCPNALTAETGLTSAFGASEIMSEGHPDCRSIN